VKEKLKEFWIRGKQINPVNYKIVLKRQLRKILKREIKYISSFFPYSITGFHNPDLVYLQAVLLADSFSEDSLKYASDNRLINLISGLELLSIGISFHNFKTAGSNITVKNFSTAEKKYTLDLLFGDIFYSRAVIYLLKYQDHEVFGKILGSMKRLHESRLKLHMKIQDAIKGKIEPSLIDSNISILIDASRLLYISFEIGDSISDRREQDGRADKYREIAERIVLLKTYNELLEYMHAFPRIDSLDKISDYLNSKNNFICKELNSSISKPGPDKFKPGIDTLLESLNFS